MVSARLISAKKRGAAFGWRRSVAAVHASVTGARRKNENAGQGGRRFFQIGKTD
jgi:hypothetical protein